MSKPYDIRGYKKNLRIKYKAIRRKMEPEFKTVCDNRIRGQILALPEYKACRGLLCFVSTSIEVDTRKLIQQALFDNKTVAVPYCVEGTKKMRFYCINSIQELEPRTFGVLEPNPDTARRFTDFTDSLCILPGLAFDSFGYRLGYGGGYYDRFLSKIYQESGITVGVCYSSCIQPGLPHGRYDMPCNVLVTEKYVRYPVALKPR